MFDDLFTGLGREYAIQFAERGAAVVGKSLCLSKQHRNKHIALITWITEILQVAGIDYFCGICQRQCHYEFSTLF